MIIEGNFKFDLELLELLPRIIISDRTRRRPLCLKASKIVRPALINDRTIAGGRGVSSRY